MVLNDPPTAPGLCTSGGSREVPSGKMHSRLKENTKTLTDVHYINRYIFFL